MSAVFLVLLLTAVGFFLALGVPVAFALAGASTLVGVAAYAFGLFDIQFFVAITSRIFASTMTNAVLLAVPMFIFMGVVLERSKVAYELLETMGAAFGRLRGGLAYSVVLVGMLMAASTGVVGATVVTMGLLSLPTMLRHGCNPALSCGVICASGTLGQIIPPSIVLILLGEQISNGYVEARRRIGDFSPEPVSVGDLFVGAIMPGLLLVALYLLFLIVVALFSSKMLPATTGSDDNRMMLRRVLTVMAPPLLLIVAVLGAILLGLASPTESAGVGAVGAILLAGQKLLAGRKKRADGGREDGGSPAKASQGGLFERLFKKGQQITIPGCVLIFVCLLIMASIFDLRLGRESQSPQEATLIFVAFFLVALLFYGIAVATWRLFKAGLMRPVVDTTMRMSALVFTILVGATMFSLVFRALEGDVIVHNLLTALPGGFWGQFMLVMVAIFILGFFLDFIEIIVIVIPIVTPTLLQYPINPVWFGVMIAVNLQTSFLTPPFGFALFYLRGAAPPEVSTRDIYSGTIPFIALQFLAMAILISFPEIITWLPEVVFGSDFQ